MIDIKDMVGLKVEARPARQLRFRGKPCIHPAQVDPVNEIFSPARQKIANDEKITEAFELAMKKGECVFSLNGQFIDAPIYERAKKVLGPVKEIEMS